MKLCVIAYEPHFRVMQLAICQALKFLPINSVEIFWDDRNTSRVPSNIPWSITPFSAVVDTNGVTGYIAQEFLKLSLHRVLNDDKWIVMDADVLLRQPWQFEENVWYYDPDESGQNYWFFLKYALDIDPQLERWMTPIWLCERKILQAIDSELHLRHRASIEKIYKRSGAQTFSEVELYAYYSVHFLNRRYQRRPHGLAMTPYFEFSQVWHSTNRDICLGGQDDWDPDFWKQWPEINVDIKM